MGGALVVRLAKQQGAPDARQIVAHDAAVRRGEVDPLETPSINLYLQASAAAEAREGIDARLAALPNDPYGEAVLVEWCCWDPAYYEQGQAAAKSWLIMHNDPGFTAYVQARADFLADRAAHQLEVNEAGVLAGAFPVLGLVAAVVLAWACQRILPSLTPMSGLDSRVDP